jgi:hypothetical protein
MCPLHRKELGEIVQKSTWFMNALFAVGSLRLPSWCIGAGAVRNLVWDHLHGYSEPSALPDVDVVYFDKDDLDPATEARFLNILRNCEPHIPWEVTNQAAVHLWFERYFGHAIKPYQSLEEAVGSWPEYATSVGITLDGNGNIQVIAPWGLEDLFAMKVRRNRAHVSLETYFKRIEEKQFAKRWPRVAIET